MFLTLHPFLCLCHLYVPLSHQRQSRLPCQVGGLVHRVCFGQWNVGGNDSVPDPSLGVRMQLKLPLLYCFCHCHDKERQVKQSWPRPAAGVQARSRSTNLTPMSETKWWLIEDTEFVCCYPFQEWFIIQHYDSKSWLIPHRPLFSSSVEKNTTTLGYKLIFFPIPLNSLFALSAKKKNFSKWQD